MAKLFCTEASWRIADDTVQIRGGRGYETADSLKGRGEEGIPAERVLRDARINLIIEGTSEIMRLFIAREAMDPHLRRILPLLSPKTPPAAKLARAVSMAAYYALWLPKTFWPSASAPKAPPALRRHLMYVERTSRRLARALFLAMAVHQQGLEKRQQILARFVNIGTDLFAMAASCSRATALDAKNASEPGPVELADLFCREAARRIEREFRSQRRNDDKMIYGVGRRLLEGRYAWLETDIVQ